jgi:hypothetical protein
MKITIYGWSTSQASLVCQRGCLALESELLLTCLPLTITILDISAAYVRATG